MADVLTDRLRREIRDHMDQQARAERQARERDEARPNLRSVAFGFVLLIVLALGLATFGQILFRLSEISAKGWP